MQRMTSKKFIQQFVTLGEAPSPRWMVHPFDVTTPEIDFGNGYKVTCTRVNDQSVLFKFQLQGIATPEISTLAEAQLSVANNTRGYFPWTCAVQVTDQFLRYFGHYWSESRADANKFLALLDFWSSVSKYLKKSRASKAKAVLSRIKAQKWDILTNSIYYDFASPFDNDSEARAELAKIAGMEQSTFASTYFASWYDKLYLKTVCTLQGVGWPRSTRQLVPNFAMQRSRTFQATQAVNGLWYFQGYWVRTEDCEPFNGSYAPTAYVNQHRATCRTCGATATSSTLYDGQCSSCVGIEINKLVIHNYSTRAEQLLSFKLGKKSRPKMLMDNIYLGLELEYESDHQTTSVVRTMKILDGHAILKRDGSVSTGFEIVTCPASRDVHSEVFKKFFEQFESGELKLKAASNCGFHIHISKKPLSYLSLGKINAFLNNPDNYDLITKIAGRKSTYSKQDPSRKHVCFVWNNQGGSDRYNMLNINNRHTVEFRMFAPPKTYADFERCLDFVESMINYSLPCNHTGSLAAHQQQEQYLDFLAKNRKDYSALTTFLKGVV